MPAPSGPRARPNWTCSCELEEFGAEFAPRVSTAGRRLMINCPKNVSVRVTAVRLREALGALVDNAVQHGGGTVRIDVRPGASSIVIEVSDEGAGVPDAIVGHIFERGMSTVSSTGIGLGLARALIEADGGRLELRRASPPVFGIFLAAENVAENSPDSGPAGPDGQRELGRSKSDAATGVPFSGVSSSGNTQRR